MGRKIRRVPVHFNTKGISTLPFEQRSAIEQKDEIFGYLTQTNISQKNLVRLKELSLSTNNKVSKLASLVLEVGHVKPHKRRRLKFLAAKHRDLLEKLEATGLIFAHHY
jgi:hypothetical protein